MKLQYLERQLESVQQKFDRLEKHKSEKFPREYKYVVDEGSQYTDYKQSKINIYDIREATEKKCDEHWSNEFKDHRNYRRSLIWEIIKYSEELGEQKPKHGLNTNERGHHVDAYTVRKARDSTKKVASAAKAIHNRFRSSPNEHKHQ